MDAAFKMAEDNEDYGTKVSEQLSPNDDMSLLALERLNRKYINISHFLLSLYTIMNFYLSGLVSGGDIPLKHYLCTTSTCNNLNAYREPKTPLENMIDFLEFDGEQAESPRVTSLKHILPRPEFTYYGEGEYFVADSRGFESLVHMVAKSYLSYKNDSVVDPRIKFNQVSSYFNICVEFGYV